MALTYMKYQVDGKLYCNIVSSIEAYRDRHTLVRFLNPPSDSVEFHNLLIKNTRDGEREVLIQKILIQDSVDLPRMFPTHEILMHYDSEEIEAHNEDREYLGIAPF